MDQRGYCPSPMSRLLPVSGNARTQIWCTPDWFDVYAIQRPSGENAGCRWSSGGVTSRSDFPALGMPESYSIGAVYKSYPASVVNSWKASRFPYGENEYGD